MMFSPARRRALGLIGASATILLAFNGLARASTSPIVVSKDPNCGCCNGWVSHLRAAGFSVTVRDTDDMPAVKARLGVPPDLASCHTAEVNGYVVEGHVPADAIRRLLQRAPRAKGLAVPGMPIGSPGMEGENPQDYEVILFGDDARSVFARYRETTAL